MKNALWTRVRAWLRCPPPATLGDRGEAAAARYLRRQGYTILARQVREGFGELDLVAVDHNAADHNAADHNAADHNAADHNAADHNAADHDVVVFVEVKTRRSDRAGHPAEAVNLPKQQRLTRAALAFLRRHHLLDHPVRFDIVAIRWPAQKRRPEIEHILHAFEPPGQGQFFA